MIHAAGFPRIVTTIVLILGTVGMVPAYGADIFDVKVGQTVIGSFSIDAYEEMSADSFFGIAIRGGFNPTADGSLPDGYQYRWIQTVESTDPAYAWQVDDQGNTREYVDRLRTGADNTLALGQSPFYNGGMITPNEYVLPFADFPSRPSSLTSFSGTWRLSLVAVEASADPSEFNQGIPGAGRNIYLMTTFVWGFTIQNVGGVLTAVPSQPIQQVAPDATRLADAFAADPDTETFGNGAWVIQAGFPEGSPAIIPEPSSYLLALSALAAAGFPAFRSRPSHTS